MPITRSSGITQANHHNVTYNTVTLTVSGASSPQTFLFSSDPELALLLQTALEVSVVGIEGNIQGAGAYALSVGSTVLWELDNPSAQSLYVDVKNPPSHKGVYYKLGTTDSLGYTAAAPNASDKLQVTLAFKIG